MASPAQDRTTRDTPWWSERWFIAAGALLAVIVLLGVVVAISGGGTNASTAAPPAAGRNAADDGKNSRDASRHEHWRVHSPGGRSQAVPTTAPPNTQWELVGSMAAPTAPRAIRAPACHRWLPDLLRAFTYRGAVRGRELLGNGDRTIRRRPFSSN